MEEDCIALDVSSYATDDDDDGVRGKAEEL